MSCVTIFEVSRVTTDREESSGQRRNKRYRQNLAERGIKPFQVMAPEETKDLFRKAASLITRDDDPMEPRAAFRVVGGSNEPEQHEPFAALLIELEAARSRITEIEGKTEQWQVEVEALKSREMALQAERDEARAAEAEGRAKINAVSVQARESAMASLEAQGRATEALQRAVKAETAIRQAKTMSGIKGRLVRWLARDVLSD